MLHSKPKQSESSSSSPPNITVETTTTTMTKITSKQMATQHALPRSLLSLTSAVSLFLSTRGDGRFTFIGGNNGGGSATVAASGSLTGMT